MKHVMSAPDTVRRQDQEQIALLVLDYPDRRMNVVDERLLSDLERHLDAAVADPAVRGVVLSSGKPTFGAGADIAWLPELAARPDAEEFLAGVHRLMVRMVHSDKPVVAAVNGTALGGALELALGARALVASEGASLGLPEVTLGLIPGGGGTQLISRFVGTAVGAELVTSGRQVSADEALEAGLVHTVVPEEELLAEAVALADRLAAGRAAVVEPRHTAPAQVLADRREALRASRAGLSVAAEAILEVMHEGLQEGLEQGLAAERRAFLRLLASPEVRATIHLNVVRAQIRRSSRGGAAGDSRLAVVGGGQMGSGIAATAVTRGLSAVVRDVQETSLQRAESYLDRVLQRTSGADPEEVRSRWSATTTWDGFGDADAVVEAVFELPELKKEVLSSLSGVVRGDALIATNTSAISIDDLASAVLEPQRFIGMHFFSPVERMPLVELIPHAGTSAATAARAAGLAGAMGKVPITVGNAPGFFTSRVYARWLIEGLRLLLDGASPDVVDGAAKDVGFPVGPLQAHDEATLELVLQASVGQVADSVMTDRLDIPAVRQALQTLIGAGVRGRRHGLGFYTYRDGKRSGVNEEVVAHLGHPEGGVDRATAAERLLLAFVSECLLCWDDGTLCHPDDGDVGATLGIGFPRALGGPFHWADEIGHATLVARLCDLGDHAYPTGSSLLRLADGGGRFAQEPRLPAPFAEPEYSTPPDGVAR